MASKYARRHYEDTAEILRVQEPKNEDFTVDYLYKSAHGTWRMIQRDFRALYADDNPRFNVERFNAACGLS